MPNKTDYKSRALRVSALQVSKRLIKPLPLVGSAFAIGLAGYTIKKKGLIRGSIDVALNVTPIIGTAKTLVEIFTGDVISEKKVKK